MRKSIPIITGSRKTEAKKSSIPEPIIDVDPEINKTQKLKEEEEQRQKEKLEWAISYLQNFLSQPVPLLKPSKKYTKTIKWRASMRLINSSQGYLKNVAAADKVPYGAFLHEEKKRRKSWTEVVSSWETQPRPLLQKQPRRMSVIQSIKEPAVQASILRTRPAAQEEALREAEREDRLTKWGIKAGSKCLILAGRTLYESDYQILSEFLKMDYEFDELNLSRCNINSKATELLANGLTTNSALQRMVLQNCNITDQGVETMSKLFFKNETLLSFDCRSCPQLTWHSGQFLFDGIQGNEGIKILNGLELTKIRSEKYKDLQLRSLNLGEPEACLLANLLKQRKSLTSLSLSNNNFNATSTRLLCGVLQNLPKLKSLSLNKNKLTRHGLPYICRLLENTTSLENLSLANNALTDEGWNDGNIRALATALLKNTCTKKINLEGNWVSNEVLSIIQDKLRVNRSLLHDPRFFWAHLNQKFDPQPAEGCLFDMNDGRLLEKVDRRFLRNENVPVQACEVSFGDVTDSFSFQTSDLRDVTPPRTRENSY